MSYELKHTRHDEDYSEKKHLHEDRCHGDKLMGTMCISEKTNSYNDVWEHKKKKIKGGLLAQVKNDEDAEVER